MNFNKDVILLLFTIQVLLLVITAFLAFGLAKILRYLEVIRSHGCNILIGTDVIADRVSDIRKDTTSMSNGIKILPRYSKADYIMCLHKEYGVTLERAQEAHDKALAYMRDKATMKG